MGDHGRTRTATVQALDLLPLPNWATWPWIPSELERMAGFEPAPQGLEGPQATVTPHSPWFGLGSHQAEHGPVAFTGLSTCVSCQRPRSCERPSYRPFWRQRQD